MKRYQLIIILLNLVLALGIYHFSVMEKEKTLATGKLVLLELAPVDPRSLMQGDYISLRYAIAGEINENVPRKGYYVITLDSGLVAHRQRIQAGRQPLNSGEYLIQYHSVSWRHSLGAEDYFFQEGRADTFALARYGGLRIDDKGNSILVGLYDEKKNLIQ
ncbi:GDYXXLXY domain-containing protein [Pseudoflavitalea rhizosphaerae]|uniref:GDYXXLXY domain-containing protein n=1 Tax=Pseudoflavitalea rhizosphaerae TaxID=1884793 RepID=UPI000F8C48EF|nr:GDYXXLXY domain-containing protein [Pseudoflavitalea rhizosphaerae]